MRAVILLVLIICNGLTAYSQNYVTDKTASKKALDAFGEFNTASSRNDSATMRKALLRAISIEPNFIDAYYRLGELDNLVGNYNKSIDELSHVLELSTTYKSKTYYLYGTDCWALNRYDSATQAFKKYLAFKDPSHNLRMLAQQYLQNSQFAAVAIKHPVPFSPVSLGDSINTPNNMEYLPTLTVDEKTLVFTRNSNHHEDFYMSKNVNGVWRKAVPISDLNTANNQGAESISADGNYFFFTGCSRPDGYGDCDIYYSYKQSDGSWSKPQNIGPPINTPSWESQPSISPDGKDLYFSSTRKGGRGNEDIWVSHLNNNQWGDPVDLDSTINTPFDEVSPFIAPDNQTLYFSSSGHPGMGGLDIFFSRKDSNGHWGKPVNLGYPINTKADDDCLIVNGKGDMAYFASNRNNKKGNIHLYSFPLYPAARPTAVTYIKGLVYDARNKNNVIANLQLIDLQTGKVVMNVTSDPLTGSYLMCIPVGKDYAMDATAAGYLFYSENFSVKNNDVDHPYELNIPLKHIDVGSTAVLRNIFFETNKYDLKRESYTELDKLIDLMNYNPNLKIEISGHTDNQGTPEYNQTLSEQRAKAVNDYLVKHGIEQGRLTYKGYGQTKPIGTNDTDEGRAQNRRTEITIIAK
jgi:outer membrane protein OmpA-like peptidoglycan-associated protein